MRTGSGCTGPVLFCDIINAMKQVRISVRSLVEFLLREGDIDNRTAHDQMNAMQEGGRLHRKIQREQGGDYHAEVPLSYTHFTDGGDIAVVIDGRADGIIESSPVTIDEIKGTYRHLDKMDAPMAVHLAQAKCYAYIYALQNELDDIDVRMTYVNMDTERVRFFVSSYSFTELRDWFNALMNEYEKWVRLDLEWKDKRNASIKTLEFPYEYREGQKELVTHVYHTIVHGRKLFMEAPTGVGKTIATVFPSVKAIGEGKANRLFYLTAKTITRTVADDTVRLLEKKGLSLKSIVLTAKDKICFLDERMCNPEACPYAKGHFDRINEALFAILSEKVNYNRETIEEYAEKYEVCPFEFALDISLFTDMVICDYNYLFDPHVYLKRFFAEGKNPDNILLIDEAHNLVDRGRAMYSASLCKEEILALKRSVKVYDAVLAKRLESINKEMLSLKRACADTKKYGYHVYDDISSLVRYGERLYDRLLDYLENHDPSPVRDEVLDFTFILSHFLYIYELMDEKYVTYGYFDSEGAFCIRLYCVDPSDNLKGCMKRGISSILFSATLLPIRYFKSLLGGEDEDYEVYAKSSFDPAKRAIFLAEGVTTKYTERGPVQYERIAEMIRRIVVSRYGNYMVFFPSYSFMDSVFEAYKALYSDAGIVIQNDRMSEEEREDFLNRFTGSNEHKDESLVGFCVLGGIFSEGIDLQGKNLIGSLVVGTGIPMVCDENELIKDYFDRKDGDGFGMKYAYIYPGFNKVLQAAGRVIRTHDDVGIVALLDYRFGYSSYRELYPREWKEVVKITKESASDELMRFWNSFNE